MDKPLLSIIMSIYNSETFMDESIRSILQQDYKNLEIIIVDDGSTDSTLERLRLYNDERIVIVENECNIGLAASLNKAIQIANGKYIARMDADDICLKKRFVVQVGFLENNPQVDICGSYISRIDNNGRVFKKKSRAPKLNSKIKASTIFSPCLFHPTVLFRAKTLISKQIKYDESFMRAQDFELWSRLVFDNEIIFHNISQVLLKYRDIPSKQNKDERNQRQGLIANEIRRSNFLRIGIDSKVIYDLLNRLMQSKLLSKYEILRVVVAFRYINKKSRELFFSFPQVSQLKAICTLGPTKYIPLIFRERLYRNLSIVNLIEIIVLSLKRALFF